jgi:hypothetical protein
LLPELPNIIHPFLAKMAFLHQFSLYLLLAKYFFFTSSNAAGDCPSNLLDGQMLDFANPGGIRLHKSEKNIMCPQMLLCDVISAPAEVSVFIQIRFH